MHWRRLRPCPSPCNAAYEIGHCEGRSIDKGRIIGWIHQTFPNLRNFAWQQGYGAFSVGISQVQETVHYIEQQLEHHRTRTFQEEYLAFLKKHGAHFDEKDLWDYLRPIIPYPTLRDGSSFEGRFPRHFVPGYDRCCPYGTRLQIFRNSI